MQVTKLGQYKKKKNLSGKEMAQYLGISESYLSEVLSGHRSLSKRLALRISERTGIPVLNLLYPSDEARP
ncbi:MAG: helix-turn-helix transcriptional regulator [Deltaproteobacteria bacterium]|nr:helix-turn-helix transcriptional regulator [Deltaproteobacteria bacterium]